jgi:hypothetical protein
MKATSSSNPQSQLPVELQNVLGLSRLLERLEHSPQTASPEQYLSVVEHLTDSLRHAGAGEVLDAILSAHPAASQVYENLHYEHAGLCRSALNASMESELRARELLVRAAGAPRSA